GDAGAVHRGLEAVRLCHRPRGHIAAVAPAHDAERVGVRDTALDQRVDAGHDVLEVESTPVLDHGALPFVTVAGRAPRVGHQHRVAIGGIPLRVVAVAVRLEVLYVCPRRSAVDLHDERNAHALAIVRRIDEHASTRLPSTLCHSTTSVRPTA